VKLTFLGTCGGRFATGEQLRNTGGIVLESDETRVHIDPGPGALVQNHEIMDEPFETEGLIVSHGHLDHVNDAEAIIEMMTEVSDKPAAVFANETALEGHGDIENSIGQYHRDLCARVDKMEEGTELEFKDLEIKSQEMFHSDPRTQGFKISDGEKTVGFWTDSEFSEELLEFYEDCDWLIIYCTRPKGGSLPQHLSLDEVPEIIQSANPTTAIITHFGYKFLKSDMEEQEEWINEQVEAKVRFAEDGMKFPGNRSLGDF